MESSVLIISGGLDSAVSAFIAKEKTNPKLALFFDYRQRAALAEKKGAQQIARKLEIPFRKIEIPWLSYLGQSALTNRSLDCPTPQKKELGDLKKSQKSAQAVWVPNRNGIFLNIAAAFAESLGAKKIVTGFNKEEAVTFSDNSESFVKAAKKFFLYSTQNKVEVISYTQKWNKTEIVKQGLKRGVIFERLWSCYLNGKKMCGRCESCQRSIRAYEEAGIWKRMRNCFI